MSDKPVRICSADELYSRIQKAGADLVSIGQDLAMALDANPKLMDDLVSRGLPKETLHRFERLGRGTIHPALVHAWSDGAKLLLTVPLSEQARYLQDGIPVLDDDEQTVREIPVNDLTSKQARQAIIKEGHVRSICEQRTYIREKKAKENKGPVERTRDYHVRKDAVEITRPGRFSKALLLQWLMEMN